MRKFFQKKAGATYHHGTNLTAAIRKNEMELIYAIDGGWHAVINVIISGEMILLFANLGDFNDKMEKLLPKVTFKDGEMPKFMGMLSGKSIYTFMEVSSDGKEIVTGITRRLPPQIKHPLEILGDPKIHKEAEDLLNHTLSFYRELRTTTNPHLKSLIPSFFD